MAGDYNGFRAERVEDSKGYYDVVYDPVTRREVEVTGPLEVAQACELRLKLWQTGWILDRDHGFPWFRFLGQKFDPRFPTERAFLDAWIRFVAQKDPRITRIDRVMMELDKNRNLAIILEGATMHNEQLAIRVRTPL